MIFILTLCMLGNLADRFFHLLFFDIYIRNFQNLSVEHIGYQSDQMTLRLIWVQYVCKGYNHG